MKLSTSVTITTPFAVQSVAVPLLRQHAYDLPRRLPAHISVLYPFVEPDDLDSACATLRRLCADVPPFPLTVAGYGEFPGVLYLGVQPSPPLEALIRRVQSTFPDCVPYSGMFGDDPVPPHVTVGVFNSRAKQQSALRPAYPPQTFTVQRLHVSIGTTEHVLPWLVHDVIPLAKRTGSAR